MNWLLTAIAYVLVGHLVFGYVSSKYRDDDDFRKTMGQNGCVSIVLFWPLLLLVMFGEWLEDEYGGRR